MIVYSTRKSSGRFSSSLDILKAIRTSSSFGQIKDKRIKYVPPRTILLYLFVKWFWFLWSQLSVIGGREEVTTLLVCNSLLPSVYIERFQRASQVFGSTRLSIFNVLCVVLMVTHDNRCLAALFSPPGSLDHFLCVLRRLSLPCGSIIFFTSYCWSNYTERKVIIGEFFFAFVAKMLTRYTHRSTQL